MADQDFNIKVVTTADTSGIRQTSDALKNLQQQQKDFLAGGPAQTGVEKFIAARQAAAAASAESAPLADAHTSVTGTAIGLGTIVTLLTSAVNKWREFENETDRNIEAMVRATEKMRELGESILEMQDKARNAARVGTEPLVQSFIRLQQEIIRLKTEQNLLDLPREGEEWKKLNVEITNDAALLRGVTSELQKQQKQAEATALANERAAASFMKSAVETAAPQVQAVLKNEEAARQARIAGNERDADLFQKSANQLKDSMSQAQREEYEGLTKPVRLGPKAGLGESQSAIDDIARNKINFDRQLKGEPPLPAGDAKGNQALIDAIHELRDQWR